MDIDFESSTGGSSGNANFENFARWADEQVSKAVVGQTMTTDDGSSQSQATVHNDVRMDIAKADARSVRSTINRDIVKPFVDLNFGVQKVYPLIDIGIDEPEDLDMQLRHGTRLVAVGVPIKAAELRAKAGFSDPEADDEIAIMPSAQTAPATNTARNAADPSPSDELEEIEREMLEEWEDVMADMLDPFEDMIATAESYEDALAKITALAPGLGASKLIEALVKGSFKARSTGDVKDG